MGRKVMDDTDKSPAEMIDPAVAAKDVLDGMTIDRTTA